jgi:hypothetical protein
MISFVLLELLIVLSQAYICDDIFPLFVGSSGHECYASGVVPSTSSGDFLVTGHCLISGDTRKDGFMMQISNIGELKTSGSSPVFKIFEDIKGFKCTEYSAIQSLHICIGSLSTGEMYVVKASNTDLTVSHISRV